MSVVSGYHQPRPKLRTAIMKPERLAEDEALSLRHCKIAGAFAETDLCSLRAHQSCTQTDGRMKIEKMLIAVDFSDTASEAARYATAQFAPEAEVILLHVIDPPRRPRFARDALPPDDTLEAVAREYAARRMVELSTYLTPARVRTEIPVGPGRAGGRDGFRGRRNRRHLPPWYGSRTRIDLCAC